MGNKHRIRKRKKKEINKKLLTGVLATTIALSGVVMPALDSFGIGSTSMVAHASEVEGDYSYIDNGDGTATITDYTGSGGDVVIPNELGGLVVTEVADASYLGGSFYAKGLTSVSIPNTIVTIGEEAFSRNDLVVVNIPDSVTSIGDSAFSQNKLTEIEFSKNLSVIGHRVFSDNELKEIDIPNTITHVKDGAFTSNPLEIITIAESVVKLEVAAFGNSNKSSVLKFNIKGANTIVDDRVLFRSAGTESGSFYNNDLVVTAPDPSLAKQYAERKGFNYMPYVAPEPEAPEVPDVPEPEIPEGNTDSSDDAGFNITSGLFELTTTPIKHFGNIEMPAEITKYQTGFEGAFNVKDFSGKELGWRVDVSAGQFEVVEPEGGFAEGTEATILPIGTLALNGLDSINRVVDGSSDMPTSKLDGSTIIDDGTVTVVSADVGEGMGEFDLLFPDDALTLTLDPTKTKVDVVNYPNQSTPYKATVSWDLVQAP